MQFRIIKNTQEKFIVEHKKNFYSTRQKDVLNVSEETWKVNLNRLDTQAECEDRVLYLRELLKPYREYVVSYCEQL